MNNTNEMQTMTDAELAAIEGGFPWALVYTAVDEIWDFCKGFAAYQPSHEVVWSTISYE